MSRPVQRDALQVSDQAAAMEIDSDSAKELDRGNSLIVRHAKYPQSIRILTNSLLQDEFATAMELNGHADVVEAGVFACQYTPNNDVNPCMSIEGVGTIGLPLSSDVALAIISASINTSNPEQQTFQIQPDQLTCTNPGWKDFVNMTARTVCTNLGIKIPDEVSCVCELERLLVYGLGPG